MLPPHRPFRNPPKKPKVTTVKRSPKVAKAPPLILSNARRQPQSKPQGSNPTIARMH